MKSDVISLDGEGTINGRQPDKDDFGFDTASSWHPVRVYISETGELAAKTLGDYDEHELSKARAEVEKLHQTSAKPDEVYLIVGLNSLDHNRPPLDEQGMTTNRLNQIGKWVSNTNQAIDVAAWQTVVFGDCWPTEP